MRREGKRKVVFGSGRWGWKVVGRGLQSVQGGGRRRLHALPREARRAARRAAGPCALRTARESRAPTEAASRLGGKQPADGRTDRAERVQLQERGTNKGMGPIIIDGKKVEGGVERGLVAARRHLGGGSEGGRDPRRAFARRVFALLF